MDFSGINYWTVLVAWLINMMVGAFWYSPAGFTKQWAKHTGVDILKLPSDVANRILLAVAASSLVQAATLGVVIHSLKLTTASQGLVAGLVLWFGLTAATTVGVTLYQKRSWKFLWLNSSYFLLVMSVNAVLLAVWR